jgi:hypothetical protein
MRHVDRAGDDPVPVRHKKQEAVMRLLALGAAITIVVALSFGVNAADLAYPSPALGPSQYGLVPPPAVAPPGVIVVPRPAAPSPYDGAPVPPPVGGFSPYGVAPPLAPQVSVAPDASLSPRAACDPVWRCDHWSCGWPGCKPHPEFYSGRYASPGPQVNSQAPPAPEPYSGPYAPRVYSAPTGPYADDLSPYRP